MNQKPDSRPRIRLIQGPLPPLADVVPFLGEIWNTGVLSNGGPLELRFQAALEHEFRWRNVCLVSSCTLGIQLLLRAHRLEGEVIVPALSHPSTYQAIRWNGLIPVPVDIEPRYLTLDPARVTEAITSRTSAILAVHLFSHPSDVTALERIAAKRDLTLLFDAASSVGVEYNGVPLTNYGHGSSISLHATKILGVGEGGIVTTRDPATVDTIRSLRNFGLSQDRPPYGDGTNAKLSELASALGLAALPYLSEEIRGREVALAKYQQLLNATDGVDFVIPRVGTIANFSYAVMRLRTQEGCPAADRAQEMLDAHGIDSRRYFGGSYRLRLDHGIETPVADAAAADLLCVPLWAGMSDALIDEICTVIRQSIEAR